MMATDGDLRVQVAMDLVLSAVLSIVAVRGLSLVGPVAFSWTTVGFVAVVLAAVSYVAVLR